MARFLAPIAPAMRRWVMRAISLHPSVAWATIHAGLDLPPAGDGVLILHTGRSIILPPTTSARLAKVAPGGPRTLPRGYLVGIARTRRLRVVAAWPLPHVRHSGSSAAFAVDQASLGAHGGAYAAAWDQMSADHDMTATCRACRDSACEGTCLLASAFLTDQLGAPTMILQR